MFGAWHTEAFARTSELPELRGLMAQLSGDGEDESDPDDEIALFRFLAATWSSSGG